MKIWKDSYCIPEDKFKKVLIGPKYLYSTDVLNKINKLRDIFLEFDEDGSSINITLYNLPYVNFLILLLRMYGAQ